MAEEIGNLCDSGGLVTNWDKEDSGGSAGAQKYLEYTQDNLLVAENKQVNSDLVVLWNGKMLLD